MTRTRVTMNTPMSVHLTHEWDQGWGPIPPPTP